MTINVIHQYIQCVLPRARSSSITSSYRVIQKNVTVAHHFGCRWVENLSSDSESSLWCQLNLTHIEYHALSALGWNLQWSWHVVRSIIDPCLKVWKFGLSLSVSASHLMMNPRCNAGTISRTKFTSGTSRPWCHWVRENESMRHCDENARHRTHLCEVSSRC